jgi:hypothetical protein
MSKQPKTWIFQSLDEIALRLRDDFHSGNKEFILLYAHNGTGKTRLSTEFKNKAPKNSTGENTPERDTLYFNAFTEDLFYWDNDHEDDQEPRLLVNPNSSLLSGFSDLSIEESIAKHFHRYCTARFEISLYSPEEVAAMSSPNASSHALYRRFGNELETKPKYIKFKTQSDEDWIKISRGEERIFVWSTFLSFVEQVLKGESSYRWVKFLYIDDPISSLDDNNVIAVATDLAGVLRDLKARTQIVSSLSSHGETSEPLEHNPIKAIVSSHHALFFNILFNSLKGSRCRHYFLNYSTTSAEYTLRVTDETPFFHHVALLCELRKAAQSRLLYTYHFNILRSILEKTAIFLGKDDFRACLEGIDEQEICSRTLDILSHGNYSLFEPVEMLEDNKDLFQKILSTFIEKYNFDLPSLLSETAPSQANANQLVQAAVNASTIDSRT